MPDPRQDSGDDYRLRVKPVRIACVGAVVHDPAGRLLLVRRANPPSRGLWSVPGGRVEPGETEPEAVRRELREETGLDLEPGRRLGSVEIDAGSDGAVLDVTDYFVAATSAGEPRAGDDADEVGWFTRAELDGLALVPGLRDALTAWQVLPS